MAVIYPNEEFKVSDFMDFCKCFNIFSLKIQGENGTDEELIIEELNKIKNKKYTVAFIDDKNDGYFKIQEFE